MTEEEFEQKKKELEEKKKAAKYLGTEVDPIMNLPMEKFDTYTIYDVQKIEQDLRFILFNKMLDNKFKMKAKKRYKEVVDYILENLRKKDEQVKQKAKQAKIENRKAQETKSEKERLEKIEAEKLSLQESSGVGSKK